MQKFIIVCLTGLLLAMVNCSNKQNQNTATLESIPTTADDQQFNAYWYGGKAEITSYELEQLRYGEVHPGEAVLIFVTEDFLLDRQVKDEGYSNAPSASVLKLNFVRKFPTGIYDYSMMTSTFCPVTTASPSLAIKVSSSAQEWCGHAWLQLNRRDEQYDLTSYSYFEKEGDVQQVLKGELLEDALWTQLRLNPKLIPIGRHELFPSAQYVRLAHLALTTYKADISVAAYEKDDMPGFDLQALMIEYPSLGRKLEIIYSGKFPHEIAGWKETYTTGYGKNAKKLTSVARKIAQIKSPYWSQNQLKDGPLRDSLKLQY